VSDLVLTTAAAGPAPPGGVPPGLPERLGGVPPLRRWRGERRVTADTYATALRAELGAAVTSLEVSARTPDGGTEILLFARDFDASWPTPYIFKEPVLLRHDSVVTATAYTGDANPPSPPRLTISGYPAR
jgi:hypothetical protein